MQHDPLMIYGATGYTGRLIASRAATLGIRPVVAGRSENALREVAAELNLPYRVAALGSSPGLAAALDGIEVLLNVAGPFSATAGPVVRACIETGTHYLDVSGELGMFEMLYAQDSMARERDVLIMPGAGFVNVPSDCLAAHVAARMPTARYLRIGISRTDFISSGSMRTMVELVNDHVRVRRAGRLTRTPVGRLERLFDYGSGPSVSTAVSWPDVFTAYLTTGIPNIEVYVEANYLERGAYQIGSMFARALRSDAWQNVLKSQTSSWAASKARAGSDSGDRTFIAEAEDGYRRVVSARLRTPEGYRFTAESALLIAGKVLAGEYASGFQTPAGLYGPTLVCQCSHVELTDQPAA